ncbi:type III-B CRISPR module-associated protein Cmr5 [Verrucomicrobia bacterium S94]|nr:type III-B CRISPR module-associated protein Cmr5 [Verrucomicrobia bacterium S94]
MKNLDQIRAKNALYAAKTTRFSGTEGGGIIKKVPTMIRENGLLGALAFACEKKKDGTYKNGDFHKVFEQILVHLQDERIGALKKVGAHADDLLEHAVLISSAQLRVITDEAMAYLAFLRRFASDENGESDE